jgi:predicted  nucleic acid-binding Zn-ribbon protein
MIPLSLAKVLPNWVLWLSVIFLISCSGVYGFFKGVEITEDKNSAVLLAIAKETIRAQNAARLEEQRRFFKQKEITENAQSQLNQAKADATDAATAALRLRQHISTLTGRVCAGPSNTPVTSGGSTDESTSDMLADMQLRLDEATREIAEYADAARIAGQTCEQAYDSLSTVK